MIILSLKKRLNNTQGTFIWRQRNTGTIDTGGVNVQNCKTAAPMTGSVIEAAIDNMPTFDTAAPSTLKFVNFTTGDYSKEVYIAKFAAGLQLVNNYLIPVRCKIWLCKVKTDTSHSPCEAWDLGIADVTGGAHSNMTTAMLSSPFDSDVFRDLYYGRRIKS